MLMKIMKINKIAASWNRAKVSLGAGPRPDPVATGLQPRNLGIHEISRNPLKTYENYENL